LLTPNNLANRISLLVALLLMTSLAAFSQQRKAPIRPAKSTIQKSAPDWWKHAVYYEIYPRSFYDTDGDGVGDLNGITAKLDYLADLGIDALWITPFYPSPQVDFGYDVSDYEAVDPQYGTLADFDRLVREAHKRNIKIVCDFVINHTSDQHPYFQESRSSRVNPKRDWYVWRDPKPNGDLPSDWISAFGPNTWAYDEKTKQYYYHYFYPQQPDLNWRNPEVERAMFNSVRFWLKRGVDGFRVDAIDALFEDPLLLDNRKARSENFEVFRRLRSVVAEFGPDRVLIGETYPPKVDDLRAYYGKQNDAFQLPFNFSLMRVGGGDLYASIFRHAVAETERALGKRPTTYVLSNHDRPRAFDFFGDGKHNDEVAKLLALMLLTLRGAPFFYYGEEIGMKTTPPERLEDVRDPIGKIYWPKRKGRDGERTPMQWTNGRNAGFSSAEKTWLPVPSTATTHNVETLSKDPNSILDFYKQAIRLRRASPALLHGDYRAIGDDPHVFAYRRQTLRQTAIVALNMSNERRTLRLSGKELGVKESELRWAISSQRRDTNGIVETGQVTLAPYEAAVFTAPTIPASIDAFARAQVPQEQVPQAKVRELASVEGEVAGWCLLPNGHLLIYQVGDSTFTYDLITKQRTLLGTDMSPESLSPQGDRFAFSRSSEDHKERFLWTLPIDPTTGAATGPALRVSAQKASHLRFSPDGRMLVFTAGPRADNTWDVTLVAATGGAERVAANYPHEVNPGWSADGKFLYVEVFGSGSTPNRRRILIDRVPAAGGLSESLFPVTSADYENVVGVSPDGRIAFYQENPDRFFYLTASGATGEISVALPKLDDGWGYDFTLDSMRYITMGQMSNSGGQTTSKIYELDMSPILRSIGKH